MKSGDVVMINSLQCATEKGNIILTYWQHADRWEFLKSTLKTTQANLSRG